MTPEIARAAIGRRFPMVDTRDIECIGSGWEFDVYATGDGWAFRFPRRAETEGLFERERPVLEIATSALSGRVAVPRVELVGEATPEFPYRFAGHRLIRGVTADSLDPPLRSILAVDIADALGAIHEIDVDHARRAGVVQADPDEIGRQTWFANSIRAAEKARGSDPIVDHALDWARRFNWPSDLFDFPLCLVHQDLGTDHLIADPRTGHLVGIIDWTDTTLGDAARDFVFLVAWQGWEYAADVLRRYPRSVDERFRYRLDLMARILTVSWLGVAQQQGADVAPQIEWLRHAFSKGQSH